MVKNIARTLLATFLLASLCCTPLQASEVSDKLREMHKHLTNSYQTKGGEPGVTLAILPFDTTEKLAKMKVGGAVAEILGHYFTRDPNFQVIERTRLEDILKEHRLGLTGAIEEDRAIHAGKLLGAQVLVLGSVQKLGKSYQINARMVEVNTGQVLSTDFASVSVQEFDESAAPYLSLVPSEQTIGLYASATLWSVRVKLNNPIDVNENSISPPAPSPVSIKGVSNNYSQPFYFAGVGLRYFPIKFLMLDVSGSFTTASKDDASRIGFITSAPVYLLNSNVIEIKNPFNASVNYVKRFRNYLNLIGGAGVSMFEISMFQRASAGIRLPSNAFQVSADSKTSDKLYMPFIRLGGEWRPQQRVGISLFANYLVGETDLTTESVSSQVGWSTNFSGSSHYKTLNSIPTTTVTIGNEFNFTSAISFYF